MYVLSQNLLSEIFPSYSKDIFEKSLNLHPSAIHLTFLPSKEVSKIWPPVNSSH